MGLTIFKIFIWGGISSDTSQGGGGGVLSYFHAYVGSGHFWGSKC